MYRYKNKSEYMRLRVNKNELQFTTPTMLNLINQYDSVKLQLEEKERSLREKIIEAAISYWPVLEAITDKISTLDVLLGFSFMIWHSHLPYVKPKIVNKELKIIHIENGYHPLLSLSLFTYRDSKSTSNEISIIPNSIHLDSNNKIHIITGPNMGGKSTFLRLVGVLCIMSQVGCYIPCTTAEISVLEFIFCRIGASDDHVNGISTFYSEMIETAAVTHITSQASLVLIDELGRGTSNTEGLAIAWGVTKYIAQHLDCFCIFATHFDELTLIGTEMNHIENFKTDFEQIKSKLVFLYKIKKGICDNSYGIKVAESAHLNSQLISKAKVCSNILSFLEITKKNTMKENPYLYELKHLLNDFDKKNIINLSDFKKTCLDKKFQIHTILNFFNQL